MRSNSISSFPQPALSLTIGASLSMVKEFVGDMSNPHDLFQPLKVEVVNFLKNWETYPRKAQVQDDFIGLASKLGAQNKAAVAYTGSSNENLLEQLDAIVAAVNQLSEAMVAGQQRRSLSRAAETLGGVTVVRIMFIRVSALIDAVQMTLSELEYDEAASFDEPEDVVNNNANTNDMDGPAEIVNENSNENDVEDANIINNNPNDNRVRGGAADIANNNSNDNNLFGRGGITNGNANVNRVSVVLLSGDRAPSPRARIVNNNGNKNVVRRALGLQAV